MLCALVFVQAFTSLRVKSLTYDELAYIPAGYSYVRTGDYRLNTEQPPLPKLLAGVALLPLQPRLPTEHWSWTEAVEGGAANTQWAFGREFLITANDDGEALVLAARLPTVFLAMLLVVVAYLLARDLYGRTAGFLAAGLCAFSPNLLAHGRLATTDLALALFVLLSVYAYRRFTRAPGPLVLLAAGGALGLALLTKFSAVLLLPLLGLWALVLPLLDDGMRVPRWWRPRDENARLRAVGFSLAGAAAIVLVALVVTSVAYLVPGRIDIYFRHLATVGDNVQPAFLTYFAGEFHQGRVPHYFVAAFLLKTPLAFLLLLSARAALNVRRSEERAPDRWLLFAPVAVWVLVVSWRAFQIGLRYILPAYPLLFVYAAGIVATPAFRTRRAVRLAVAGLAVWFAGASLAAHPHYLPYFNELAGGPDNGIRWLDDSNVDWGQDLVLLREFARAAGVEDLKVTPMAEYDPALYGIEAEVLPPHVSLPLLSRPEPPPGVYAVSVHLLNRARLPRPGPVDPLRDLEPVAVLGHTIYVFAFGARGGG